jgi:Transposase DDE domain group 1
VKRSGLYPRVQADTGGSGVVSQAGGVALVEMVRLVAGLDRLLSTALARWRKPMAIHDPAKVITDLAVALALGGDCLADIALVRAERAVFGLVASDPTVSRTIDTLAAEVPRARAAINAARAAARSQVWRLAGEHAPDHGIDADKPLIIDDEATLVTAHSEKEQAAPHSSVVSGSIRSGPSPTTAATGPVSRWQCCFARATPGRTRQRTTSRWSRPRWRSCPVTGPGGGAAGRCSSAPTPRAPPTSS